MTRPHWFAMAVLLLLVAVSSLGAAATNRVRNNDCEEAGNFPTDTPHWAADRSNPVTARVDLLGVAQTAACVVVGPSVLRSDLFSVIGGETIEFSFDAWVIRPSLDPFSNVRGDAVGALVYYDPLGRSPGEEAIYVPGVILGGYGHYGGSFVVPAGATYATVLLGGGLSRDIVLTTPTTITAFDNIFVGN